MTKSVQSKRSRLTSGKVGRPRRSVTTELNETLLGLAVEALRASDYNEISLGRLAERIGVAKPTLYRRFGSKDGLVAAMVEAEFARILVKSPQAGSSKTKPLENLRRYAWDLFKVFISQATANFVKFQQQDGVDSPRIAALRRKIHLTLLDNLAELIDQVLSAEGLLKTDTHMLAALLIAQLQSPATLYGLGFSREEILRGYRPDEFFDWRFRAFLNVLRAENKTAP